MRESGGIIFDALSHHINLFSYFAGKIKNISKSEMRLAYKDIKVNDTALISIIFRNKILGIIFGNQFQKPNVDEVEFIGTKNNLIFNRIDNRLFLYDNNKKLIKSFKESYEDLFMNQLKSFITCLTKRTQPESSLLEELDNLGKL